MKKNGGRKSRDTLPLRVALVFKDQLSFNTVLHHDMDFTRTLQDYKNSIFLINLNFFLNMLYVFLQTIFETSLDL